MTTRQISFAIEGMFCAKCAVQIEGALTHLDGIAAAHVNYATQRASVVYDPTRVLPAAMVRAVQLQGFNVTLERIVLNVGDLIYASSARTVERVLGHLDHVAHAAVDLGNRQIALDVFSGLTREEHTRAISNLGLRVGNEHAKAAREFAWRAAVIAGLALLSLVSAGAHAGLYSVGTLHAPLILMVVSALAVYGVGWKFYRTAYDALLHRELDASVLVALSASGFLFVGLPLALITPASWLTGTGFVLATLLTAGWFLARGARVWLLPRWNNGLGNVQPSAQLGAISRGIRH